MRFVHVSDNDKRSKHARAHAYYIHVNREGRRVHTHEFHMESLHKSHKNTSDRHENNEFAKHSKFSTRRIRRKFRPRLKTKNRIHTYVFTFGS